MAFRVDKLTKKYGTQVAVNEISFSLKKGEIVGFIGPNGSGKSTTMKMICGILSPDSGRIIFEGEDSNTPDKWKKKLIGYLPEHNPLYTDMYIKEYLNHVAHIYNIKGRKERIAEVIKLTGLEPEQHKTINQLSKGYRQRVGLAQALMHDPEILILDEPTTGLDPNQILEIRELVSGLSKKKTVLLSTHILQEVEAICDRVIMINKGRIVADQKPSEMKKESASFQTIYLEVKEEETVDWQKELPAIHKVKQISKTEWLLESDSKDDIREHVFKIALEKKLNILSLQKKELNLEESFRELTKK